MPKYIYTCRDRTGKKVEGIEEAGSHDELISRLQEKEWIIINISLDSNLATADTTSKSSSRRKHFSYTSEDLVLFCRQLATLLGAGVTILRSLEIISQQVTSVKLYNVIKALQHDMEAGLSFHEAMARHSAIFSELWVNLVESGEASGSLAMVLARLAGYLERNEAFKRKIVSALVYPVILLIACVSALMFLSMKIIPQFASLFKGFNIQLPLITQILITVSAAIKDYFVVTLFAGIFGVYLLRIYLSTHNGRKVFENFLFHLPQVGEFFKVLVVERFTSEMSTLVESGVPILFSLEIAEHSVNNITLGEIIHKIKDEVREGKPLSVPIEKSGFFDPMTVQMIAIGEEVGELSSMLKKLNVFYQDYVDTFLTRVTAMFEPILLMVIGVGAGFIIIGMFMPIFQISQIH
ncbi:MAG: type II secretion system F family protein [Candidatus Omnitrophota bacterium]|jgi:type IV pilus assembly protein PilC